MRHRWNSNIDGAGTGDGRTSAGDISSTDAGDDGDYGIDGTGDG
jgi:hypothetical protein